MAIRRQNHQSSDASSAAIRFKFAKTRSLWIIASETIQRASGSSAGSTSPNLNSMRTAALPAPDQFDPVRVGVLHERDPGATFAHLIGRPLGLDALFFQSGERAVEVVDTDRDVAIGRTELVAATIVIEGQLQH